jgi:hypothetical protein
VEGERRPASFTSTGVGITHFKRGGGKGRGEWRMKLQDGNRGRARCDGGEAENGGAEIIFVRATRSLRVMAWRSGRGQSCYDELSMWKGEYGEGEIVKCI